MSNSSSSSLSPIVLASTTPIPTSPPVQGLSSPIIPIPIPIATPLVLVNPYTIDVHRCRRCSCIFNSFAKEKGTAAFCRCNE